MPIKITWWECLGSRDIVNPTRGCNPFFDMSLFICGGEVGGREVIQVWK